MAYEIEKEVRNDDAILSALKGRDYLTDFRVIDRCKVGNRYVVYCDAFAATNATNDTTTFPSPQNGIRAERKLPGLENFVVFQNGIYEHAEGIQEWHVEKGDVLVKLTLRCLNF